MGQVTKSEQASCDATGKTTDAHARLRPFAGTFRAEVRMWMGPGEPMLSSGTMTNTLELGGRYLHQSYKGDPNPGPFPAFEGRGYWGYNTTDNRYEGFWIDNACTFMQLELGQVESSGRVWTMHSSMTSPETGAPMRKKSVITLKDEQRHTMEMYFEAPGGEWRKIMHIEYERA
ncbi:MAG TPA: DUF1579 family protein [Phycisphaerales bacterium]|nr:DUF1579 family protein [Phycisphaerales bacterium]